MFCRTVVERNRERLQLCKDKASVVTNSLLVTGRRDFSTEFQYLSDMVIPCFPEFIPVSFEQKDELLPFFATLTDGICENTFASLFLDSYKYRYNISRFVSSTNTASSGDGSSCTGRTYIVTGIEPTEPKALCTKLGLVCRFCYILGDWPSEQNMERLKQDEHMSCCCYIRNIPKRVVEDEKLLFERRGLHPELDRDNSDYLYNRIDLAELKGKAFHKKKNLVNQFNAAYESEVKVIDDDTVPDAVAVLNAWKADRLLHAEQTPGAVADEGDFLQCSLALQYRKELQLTGIIVYADGKPAGFSLGETIGGGSMYDVHFEKGIDAIHGIYQVVNQQTALALPETVTLINREQDLGDEGLRQAKMTYRPCSMVEKYKVCLFTEKDLPKCTPDEMQQ